MIETNIIVVGKSSRTIYPDLLRHLLRQQRLDHAIGLPVGETKRLRAMINNNNESSNNNDNNNNNSNNDN